jgi:hypothetical protein
MYLKKSKRLLLNFMKKWGRIILTPKRPNFFTQLAGNSEQNYGNSWKEQSSNNTHKSLKD